MIPLRTYAGKMPNATPLFFKKSQFSSFPSPLSSSAAAVKTMPAWAFESGSNAKERRVFERKKQQESSNFHNFIPLPHSRLSSLEKSPRTSKLNLFGFGSNFFSKPHFHQQNQSNKSLYSTVRKKFSNAYSKERATPKKKNENPNANPNANANTKN